MPYKPFSEKTAEKIDEKIKEILHQAYQKAKNIISKNKEKIQKLAQILLEKEYLTKEEFLKYMEDDKALDEAIKNLKKDSKNQQK